MTLLLEHLNQKYKVATYSSQFIMSKIINGMGGSRSSSAIINSSSRKVNRETDRKVPKQDNNKTLFNPCNIQMISDELYQQIFIDIKRQRKFPENLIHKCKQHLEKHGLWNQEVKHAESIKFRLPKLEGRNIDDHFKNIAVQQTSGYRNLVIELINSSLPEMPDVWCYRTGWTKYHKDGSHCAVYFPEEDAFVFDVEVCVRNGQVPTLACAVSSKHWYSWCSEDLINGTDRNPGNEVTLQDLIPFETNPGENVSSSGTWTEKVIIGHNVSYDRAKIKEQYFLEKTKLRFIDTMSLHIAISGITSFQRALKVTINSKEKNSNSRDSLKDISKSLEWNELSSLNNLADVYKLYCEGRELKKEDRNIFVKGTIKDVQENFQSLVLYCANDVKATLEVLKATLPIFFDRFPHPVTFYGMLEMGTAYLPINRNWDKYIKSSDSVFLNSGKEVKSILVQKANEALKLLINEKYKEDPWLWDLDWKVTKPRKSKTNSLPETQPLPAWYKKLLYKPGAEDFEPGPSNISSSMQVVPKLLKLTWCGFPLYHSKTGGWGFLVKKFQSGSNSCEEDDLSNPDSQVCEIEESSSFPYKQWEEIYESSKEIFIEKFQRNKSKTQLRQAKADLKNKSEDAAQNISDFIKGLEIVTGRTFCKKSLNTESVGITASHSPHPNCEFIPLPHKNGINYRVGNPLGKDFLSKIEEGILNCQNGQDIADKVVKISKQTSYWRNNRDRICGQMVVWLNRQEFENNDSFGAIIPQVAVSGTLTRRAVEPTWMTASNAYVDRIGSELKSMIQAPPKYHFAGADVDSQELWIASAIGDAHFAKQHGSTALGWMTLQGAKSVGTDMHSMTAKVSGIARDQAKILNYARIYGAGVTFAERLLLQFNGNMSAADAKKKAKAMYQMTKGERKYFLTKEGMELASHLEDFNQNVPFSKAELQRIMSYHEFPFREYMSIVDKIVWDNGTESYMFNRLEEIAQRDSPRTPVLNCLISRSLVPSVVHNDYMTSRINWVVQSSAVDYLHLMLSCMGWLIEKFNINARFSLSVHDEVRYLVASEDRYRLALALQITNLLTRSFCSYQLGMYDLPQSVAFFSCVDVDKVLRKEVTDDCITPSNADGLQKTYGIPQGEALDIQQTLKLTQGVLQK